jgi:DNA-binding NarL/FixJ family response regulator
LINVLIVEDEPRTRDRLAAIIATHPGWRLLAQAGSLMEAHRALESGSPDVMLLDLGLPDGSGLTLLDTLRESGSATGTLVISVLGDEASVLRAIERGAGGYLLKDADDRGVVAAIEQLLAGGAPLSPSIAVHLMRRLQTPPRACQAEVQHIGLNPRELELLKLIAKGLSYEEVGQLMGLKYNTITSYTKELYRKLQVHSRAEAVFEAQQLGLVRSA